MAVVSVFEGRVRRYGTWRTARVSDYLVREYLDPAELTKRDRPSPELIPVLKANRLLEFTTGTYEYRFMSSLFFRRDTGALHKGVGTCINACGLVFQRWDAPAGELQVDSYWEHEGRAAAALPAGDWRFADELPFTGAQLANGSRLRVLPPLASPRAMLRASHDAEAPFETWLGIGDLCVDCRPDPNRPAPDTRWSAVGKGLPEIPAQVLRVEQDGRRTRFYGEDGALQLELEHDAHGFLEAWTLRDEQEFRRVSHFRGPYWELTEPEHRRLLDTR